MKHALTPALLLLALGNATADFSTAEVELHPTLPGNGPFVLELRGTWDSSCHPGMGEPVIGSFDGTVLEVDLVLDPVPPCLPDYPSPYRVLLDLSGAFDGDEDYDGQLDITIRFMGGTLSATLALDCALNSPCPAGAGTTWPETGLYQAPGFAKQGLLLARQGELLAVYPLTYDTDGSAEWLFAGGALVGDAYFETLYAASGGQCLVNCPPPPAEPVPTIPESIPPLLEAIGTVSMVFDSAGVLQMKIDEGPFVEYRQSVYGYENTGWPSAPVTDIDGRWALLETAFETQANGSIPPGAVLPLVFDINLDHVVVQPGMTIPLVPPLAVYNIRGLDGERVTGMHCTWLGDHPGCEIENPDFDDGSHAFSVEFLSADRLRLTDMGPYFSVGTAATGVIVRVD